VENRKPLVLLAALVVQAAVAVVLVALLALVHQDKVTTAERVHQLTAAAAAVKVGLVHHQPLQLAVLALHHLLLVHLQTMQVAVAVEVIQQPRQVAQVAAAQEVT
jgi:hypothetical protein